MWWKCATKQVEHGGMLLLMATSAQSIRPQPELRAPSAALQRWGHVFPALLTQPGWTSMKTLWVRWNKFLVLATLRLSYEEVIPVSCFYTFPCSGMQGISFSPSHPVIALILLSRTPVDISSFRIPWTQWPWVWLHSCSNESSLLLFRFLCQALWSGNSKYLQVVATTRIDV